MAARIPYGRHSITEEDIRSVVEVLQSEWLTQGPTVPRFEKAVATYCGVEYAIAVNSATAALHLACLALGLRRGDILWTSPITFVASANCALYCGADVDFVDIDRKTYTLSVSALKKKLADAEREQRLPKIVVPVHFAGQSCDMRAIKRLADTYGFRVLEDASHAIGGRYLGAPVGNCQYSDITVFSFHPVKIITTGEGGIAVTNQEDLANRLSLLRSHGITRQVSEMTHEPDGPWYYQQTDLGYNYRMTDLQAALGLSQAARLDDFVSRRHAIARKYHTLLSDELLTVPYQDPLVYSAMHLYPISLNTGFRAVDRRFVYDYMHSQGIGVNVHYIPVYRQPYYSKKGFNPSDYPIAEQYYSRAISLPMYSALTDGQVNHVVQSLHQALALL